MTSSNSNSVFNTNNVAIIISNNSDNLKVELDYYKNSATVEAEYGEVCVEGSVITLAHHGSRSWNDPPCIHPNVVLKLNAIGMSHVDLDSLGGVLALLAIKPKDDDFWLAAGKVDVKGAHKLHELSISEENKLKLHAFWVWSESNKLFPPRDGGIMVVNDWIEKAYYAVCKIIALDKDMLNKGKEFMERGEKLNEESFVEDYGDIVLRESESFVNHLYNGPDGKIYDIVVNFNKKLNSVTISKVDESVSMNCKDVVQALWGEKAGGHAGIAGSPRDRVMILEDAIDLIEFIINPCNCGSGISWNDCSFNREDCG